jgi:hypothetical protein
MEPVEPSRAIVRRMPNRANKFFIDLCKIFMSGKRRATVNSALIEQD